MLDFQGRVAVVTGAGRGLGRAYARLFAERGAKVVVNDFGGSLRGEGADVSPAQEVAAEIGGVADTESVVTGDAVRTALEHYGRLDILVHNAGIVRPAPITEMSDDDLDAVLDVHLRGGFRVVRSALPVMYEQGYGRIVLTSSIGGIYGNQRVANYAMAKAGLIGLSNVVALEGKEHGVRCNVIVPGALTRMAEGIDTSAYPDMDPALVAPVVAWLAHESCDVTGEMFASIAGRLARVFIGETPGVYRPHWNIEDVAAAVGEVRDVSDAWVLDQATAHVDHTVRSFAMASSIGKENS